MCACGHRWTFPKVKLVKIINFSTYTWVLLVGLVGPLLRKVLSSSKMSSRYFQYQCWEVPHVTNSTVILYSPVICQIPSSTVLYFTVLFSAIGTNHDCNILSSPLRCHRKHHLAKVAPSSPHYSIWPVHCLSTVSIVQLH